jgi:prepilin-type N-terminal cleavage/methylation domain-containing protein
MSAMKNIFSTRDTKSASTFQRLALPKRCSREAAVAPARAGFTLVELLIVIATIGILAALLMPVFHSVTIHSVLQRAQSERDQIETAISRYQAKYGFYPPGNALPPAPNLPAALTNQLYYELVGTTNIGTAASPDYLTLDNRITNTTLSAQQAFDVSGFMNCSRTGASQEDAVQAQSFLPELKPGQIANVTVGDGLISVLCTAANSDPNYQPIPGAVTGTGRAANPWRYLYPGVHNPTSYDLWIQIFIGGKTNLICNWKTDPEVNPSLP